MICSIIEKLMYLVHGVFCRHGPLCCNGSKFREHYGINVSGVVEKGSSDLLDEFLLCRCQEWWGVYVFCILCLGSACWLNARIGLVLQFAGPGLAKMCEGILNVGQHGKVYFAVGVVPVNVHAKITRSVPVM